MKINNETLERIKKLYIDGCSINDIRNILLVNCRLDVSIESIRKHLKNCIKLRPRQDAIKISHRKHLPHKNEIIRLYLENEYSLKRIAKMFKSNKKTIGKILRENSIEIRDNNTSIRLSNMKYKRFSFNKNEKDKAYFIGLVEGDLTAFRRSKYTIRVITNTTHRVFAEHIKGKFKKYGFVRIFPTKNRSIGGYMWCVQADLDNTFDFLLPENRHNEIENAIKGEYFFHFLAGFIDSDGSIIIRKAGKYFQPVVRAFGQNFELLSKIRERLLILGYNPSCWKNFSQGTLKTWVYNKDYYILEIYKRSEVLSLLRILPIEHPEKIIKKELALNLIKEKIVLWDDVKTLVQNLRAQIDNETSIMTT